MQTYIAPSKIHGLGLFASEPILAGECWWRFDGRLDRILLEDEIAVLPYPALVFVRHYAFVGRQGIVLCGDNARFVNRSQKPNSCEGLLGSSLARRDIAADEEITEDYATLAESN